MQCGACEAPKPGVTQEDLDRVKNNMVSMFRTEPSVSKPASGFTFGTPASSSSAQPFTFGAPQGAGLSSTPQASAFSFGAPQSGSAPTGGFVFKPSVDKNIAHAEKNKRPSNFADSVPSRLSGDVFVCGSGECDQLGLGESALERKKPSIIKSLRPTFTQISVGCLHTLALSADGVVFSWGCNDDGALGRSGEENVPNPMDFSGIAVKVSAGGCHSGIIDTDGNVWQCGSFKDSNGHIGFPAFSSATKDSLKEKKSPKLIRIPTIQRATQLSSGIDYMVCNTASGVFSWGDNMCGQLGQGDRTPQQPAATKDDAADERNLQEWKKKKIAYLFPAALAMPKKCQVTTIGTGSDCTFFVTKDKETYGCGLNGDFQLGIGKRTEAEAAFQQISTLDGLNVVEISGGTSHTVARTSDGHVYVWGRMDRCGVNSALVSGVEKPRRLEQTVFCNRDIVSVVAACGGTHTVARTREGDVFLWGSGDVNQLGNCPRDVNDFTEEERQKDAGDDELSPYLLTSKGLDQRYVFDVGAGAQHTVVLAWNKSDEPKATPKRPAEMMEAPAKKQRLISMKVEVTSPDIFMEAIERVWQVPLNAIAHTRGFF